MSNPEPQPAESAKPSACGGGCAKCSQMDRKPGLGELSGWSLAGGATAAFVLPLVLAVAGAILAPDAWAPAGAVAGLLIGILGAGGVVAAVRRSTRRCDEHPNQ